MISTTKSTLYRVSAVLFGALVLCLTALGLLRPMQSIAGPMQQPASPRYKNTLEPGVVISGPNNGFANTSYTFTAAIQPLTAPVTLPLTYVWQAVAQNPITHTNDLSDTVSFTWNAVGAKLLTVTVYSDAVVFSSTHTVTITAKPPNIYLPLILRMLPPGPDLIITAIDYLSSTHSATATVKNRGNEAADTWFFVDLYIDHAPTGVADKGYPFGYGPPSLAPNTSAQIIFTGVATDDEPHQLYVQADTYDNGQGSPDYGRIDESDETNNIFGPLPINQPPPPPGFTLAVFPASRHIVQGETATYTVVLTAINNLTSPVTLKLLHIPTGTMALFAQNPVAPFAQTVLTLTASAGAPTGTHRLTVQAGAGAISHTQSLTLIISALPASDFDLSVSPASRTIHRGGAVTYTVHLTATGSFSAPVTLSLPNVSSGTVVLSGGLSSAMGLFAQNPITPSAQTVLTLTPSLTTPTGTYAIWIRGAAGAISHTAVVSLAVSETALPDLAVQSLTITPITPTISNPLALTATVQNQGGLSVTAPFSVDIYIDPTLPFTPGGVSQVRWRVNELSAGQTIVLTGVYQVYTTGVHTFYARVDAAGVITESNEGNNLAGPLPVALRPTPHDIVIVLDRSGSQEFDPVCYGCWARDNRIIPDPNDSPPYSGYYTYPDNGEIYPLPFSNTNRIKVCAKPGDAGFDPLQTRHLVGSDRYMVLEAELYARNPTQIEPDLQAQPKGYWAMQRGEGNYGGGDGTPNYGSTNAPWLVSQGTTIDNITIVAGNDNLGTKLGAHMAHHPSMTYMENLGIRVDYGKFYSLSDAQLGNAPWLEYDFKFYPGAGWTGGNANLWVRVHAGRGIDYDRNNINVLWTGPGATNVAYWGLTKATASTFPTATVVYPQNSPAYDPPGVTTLVSIKQAPDVNRAAISSYSDNWHWLYLGSFPIEIDTPYRFYFAAGSTGYSLDRIIITDNPGANQNNGNQDGSPLGTQATRSLTVTMASAGREACDICNPIFGENITNPAAQCSFLSLTKPTNNARHPLFGEWESPLRPGKEAVKHLITRLNPERDQVGFVTYNSNSTIKETQLNCLQLNGRACFEGSNPISFTRVLRAVEDVRASGGTPTARGMVAGLEVLGINNSDTSCDPANLNSSCARGGSQKVMILMTDGQPNTNGYEDGCTASNSPSWYKRETAPFRCPLYHAEQATEQGVIIYTIGIGFGIDRDWLVEIARLGNGKSYVALSAGELDIILNDILAPDIAIQPTPTSQSVIRGEQALYNIKVTSYNGFTRPVTLTTSSLPAGVTAGFSANTLTPNAQIALTLTTALTTPTGRHGFNIQAVAPGVITRATHATLEVNPIPRPDLLLQLLNISPVTPTVNTPFTITAVIQNQGSLTATTPFSVGFYVDPASPPTVGDPADLYRLQNGLGVQLTATLTAPYTLSSPGVHTFYALVDATGIITEGDEGNNTLPPLTATIAP